MTIKIPEKLNIGKICLNMDWLLGASAMVTETKDGTLQTVDKWIFWIYIERYTHIYKF